VTWNRKPNNEATLRRKAEYNTAEHRQTVALCKELVAAGVAYCWRCKGHIPPGSKVHAGHDDADRTVYRGPEHPSCNLKAAASKGARIANARRKAQREAGRASVWTW
jgi:hypothetical protein